MPLTPVDVLEKKTAVIRIRRRITEVPVAEEPAFGIPIGRVDRGRSVVEVAVVDASLVEWARVGDREETILVFVIAQSGHCGAKAGDGTKLCVKSRIGGEHIDKHVGCTGYTFPSVAPDQGSVAGGFPLPVYG